MTILREWRAELRRELRDEYAAYVESTGIAAYRATPGNLGAAIALRDIDATRSEIVTLSLWGSVDEIEAFAGKSIDTARYFPEDDRYLLTRPNTVQHFKLYDHTAQNDGPSFMATLARLLESCGTAHGVERRPSLA